MRLKDWDQLAVAVYTDEFMQTRFEKVEIRVNDTTNKEIGIASVSVGVALQKVNSEISEEEFISKVDFSILKST